MNVKHLLSVAALAATLTITSTAHATVVFNGDFETGNRLQWPLGDSIADNQWCAQDDAVVYSTATSIYPPVAQGTYAFRAKADNTDVSPCTPTGNPRSQLGSGPIMANNGNVYWQSFKVRFTSVFPNVPEVVPGTSTNAFHVFQQDFAAPFSGSPQLAFGVHDVVGGGDNDVIDLRTTTGATVWSTPLVKANWLTITVQKRASSVNTAGWVRLWFNGVQQTFSNCTGAHPGGGGTCVDPLQFFHATITPGSTESNRFYLSNYYRLNQYSNQGNTASIFFDAAKVGTTEADVTG